MISRIQLPRRKCRLAATNRMRHAYFQADNAMVKFAILDDQLSLRVVPTDTRIRAGEFRHRIRHSTRQNLTQDSFSAGLADRR